MPAWLRQLFRRRSGEALRRSRLGRRGERLAAGFLRARGYAIESVNVRYPVGELDLVARDGSTLCFVEVRSTSGDRWGGPLASVDPGKQRRLLRAAQWYLHHRLEPAGTVFDVVGIDWAASGAPSIQLIQGAFEAPEHR